MSKPPEPLVVNDNVAQEWQRWLKQYQWYAIAKGLKDESEEAKVANFMCSIGDEAFKIYETFELNDTESNDLQFIIDKFTKYFQKSGNIIHERYNFNKAHQFKNETMDNFITRIKAQALKCDYGAAYDSLVLDKLVIGIKSDSIREKLLNEFELDLSKALNICRISEQTNIKIAKVHNSNPSQSQQLNRNCKFCGLTHELRNCPAFDKICNKCNNKGHFAEFCQLLANKSAKPNQRHGKPKGKVALTSNVIIQK